MSQKKFGRYEIEAEIGQGAMGKVYRAFDPLTQRRVAIKALKEEILAQDETGEYVRRFQREARAAGGLSHPNIITIFDVGENYFVMEYLEGTNLLNLLSEKGTFSLDETLRIVSPIADALAYAHTKGVFHRDVKPANIMVFPDGRPIITDFGLAHLESTVMTTAGQFLGSPSYMSPEQVIGGEITPRADLYSLSVVTYEMLTGNKPFPGKNITTVVYKVVHSAPVPPHELNPELPTEYEHIFARALAKEPEKRFASFSELVAALNLEEFDRLEIRHEEPTLVSVENDVLPAPDEQATAELPAPLTAETRASVTERKRPSRFKGPALVAGALSAVALVVLLSRAWTPEPGVHDLRLETHPAEAEVWVDGEPRGASPLELATLPFGEHVIRIEKDGFLPLEERLDLIEGEEVTTPLVFSLQPEAVSLFLESVPAGAAVKVDGKSVGETPVEDVEMAPGQHDVLVTRRGYEAWRSVVVARAGESVNLVARLRRVAKKPTPARRPATKTQKTKEAPQTAPGVFELGPDDTPAKRISGKPPAYPALARRLNQQGRVTVSFILTEEGIPTELEVVESAGPVLDRAVLDSVSAWRYEPAKRGGKPIRVRMKVRQTFRLGR